MSLGDRLVLRRLRESDSFAELTALLHRAYAPLAAEGMKFFATFQTEEDTRKRALAGECFVAAVDGDVVGTITLYPRCVAEAEAARVPYYEQPGVFTFGQLGVEPAWKTFGIGGALMDRVEARAQASGAIAIACDTSIRATRLIATYQRRGYRNVGTVQWDETNYLSVILSKAL